MSHDDQVLVIKIISQKRSMKSPFFLLTYIRLMSFQLNVYLEIFYVTKQPAKNLK